jgi:hypothetical protein
MLNHCKAQIMANQRQFRILTPDGLLSLDTYVLAAEQPRTIKAGCLLVVDARSGRAITVHDTRLFPVDAVDSAMGVGLSKRACLKCGRVEGVIEDQVPCPEHDGGPCGLVERSDKVTGNVSQPASP